MPPKFGVVCYIAIDCHKKGPSRRSLPSHHIFPPFSLSVDHTNPSWGQIHHTLTVLPPYMCDPLRELLEGSVWGGFSSLKGDAWEENVLSLPSSLWILSCTRHQQSSCSREGKAKRSTETLPRTRQNQSVKIANPGTAYIGLLLLVIWENRFKPPLDEYSAVYSS